jgi:YD repeat-containing protein
MNIKALSKLLLFFCCSFLVSSCSSEADEPEPPEEENKQDPPPFLDLNCKPAGLYPTNEEDSDDSLAYEYDAAGNLSRILHFAGRKVRDMDLIEYDDLGRLAWLRKAFAPTGIVFENFQIEYDGNSRPAILNTWGSTVNENPLKTIFTHDDKGRLIHISRANHTKWRYEYNDDNNVRKVYYAADGFRPTEVLGRENHTFDDRKKFYANVPALVTIYNYLLRFDPSKNNVTSATIYYIAPLAIDSFSPPRALQYLASYNEHGWIRRYHLNSLDQVVEFYCSDIRYECD